MRQHWAGPNESIGAYIAEETRRTLTAYESQPNLVIEHANHEEDTARGGYARRQLFELVQNGADALSGSGGGKIWIGLTSTHLYCADEGQSIDLVHPLLQEDEDPKILQALGESDIKPISPEADFMNGELLQHSINGL